MFELLLGVGSGKYVSVEYPDSGPGNKWLLAGDPQLGYFGPVSSAEFTRYTDVTKHVFPSSGQNSLKTDVGWLKFFYKGKVLYYAKTSIGLASWDILYQAGCVYGDKTTGKYPSGTPVVQYNPMPVIKEGRNWKFIPRLPSFIDTDPSALPVQPAGEFSQLMARVTTGNAVSGLQALYGKWDTFPLIAVGLVANSGATPALAGRDQGIESKLGTTANKLIYYNGFSPSDNPKTYASEDWRPVLELEGFENIITPGPSELIGGDSTAGYYGTVSSTDLVNGTDLATMVGLTAGTLQNDLSDWLKFSSNGKVIYTPKLTIRRNVTWNDLNNLSIVFGTKEIVLNGNRYSVRLLQGARTDPGTATGREWNDLMYNVAKSYTSGLKWASFTDAQLSVATGAGTGCATWCQEQWTGETGHVHRGYSSIENIARDQTGAVYNNYGWRPVLEFIGPA